MQPPPSAGCEEVRTIELALAPEGTALEICVSPGLMTGFLFDTPADVDLQDEPRFGQVLRGRSGMSVVPPQEMVPGERLRLTARLGSGPSQQIVPFMLVAHSGQATRQVEVYRDERPRVSLEMEVDQQRARNQQLREENEQLRIRLEYQQGLRGLIATEAINTLGVKTRTIDSSDPWQSDGSLEIQRGCIFQSYKTLAIQVWIKNMSSDPWMVTGAALVDSQGQSMRGVTLFQQAALPGNTESGSVVIEVDDVASVRAPLMLKLWGGARFITILDLMLPSSAGAKAG
jgi:uncharacterized protein (TIGR02268 family)